MPSTYATIVLLFLCALSSALIADEVRAGATDPGYIAEAPLPVGWPPPGPVGQIELAYLPAVRAAEASRFMSLFRHINRNNIPMTAPVIMPGGGGKAGDELVQPAWGMQFLYPDAQTTPLQVAAAVQVVDRPGQWVLRVSHRGRMDQTQMEALSRGLYQEARARGLPVVGELLTFGYNGPMLRASRRTTELALPVQLIPLAHE